MKALILAAGFASRMRPLTDTMPKCLLDIGGKCILERTVDNIVANGITSLVVVTGYLESMIREFLSARYPWLTIEYVHNADYETTNNIFSLWLAREAVRDHDILLLDSDILFDERIVAALLTSPREDCLALKVATVGAEEIKVRLDDERRVLEISKIVPIGTAAGESIGIERFSVQWASALFAVLERMIVIEGKVNVFYEAAFEEMIGDGHPLYAVDISVYPCMELDTVEDLLHARASLAQMFT